MPSRKAKKPAKSKLPTSTLGRIGESARQDFAEEDMARERALRLCREVIRNSAKAIRAVHRQEFKEADATLEETRALLDEVVHTLAGHENLFHAGLVHDAQKEFAEASMTMAMVSGRPLPAPDALDVGLPAYLNGLGEAAGELRRYILDQLRRGEVAGCEDKLTMMDDIYGLLVTMDFPDALTGGLRRTTDMVRGVLERTRGDLTLALEHRALEKKLEKAARDTDATKRVPPGAGGE